MEFNIFKITFTKPSVALVDDYERLSDNDRLKISNLEVLATYDYDLDGHYTCFMISSPIVIASYRSILDDNIIKHKCEDITTSIISGKVTVEMVPGDKERFNIFMHELEEFIYSKLDMDAILDRISLVGMGGLSDVELRFIKDYENISR